MLQKLDAWFAKWFAGNSMIAKVEGAPEHIREAFDKLKARVESIGSEVAAEPGVLAEEIDRWFIRSFHSTVVSKNTEVYNHASAAVADLQATVAAAPAAPAVAAEPTVGTGKAGT